MAPHSDHQFRWYYYWILVGIIQYLAAQFLVSLGLIILRVESATLRGVVETLIITWLGDCAVIYLLGWLGLRIRKPAAPLRLDLRLLLVVVATLLPLGIPLAVYLVNPQAAGSLAHLTEAIPLADIALLAGIIGFQLPGWLRSRPPDADARHPKG